MPLSAIRRFLRLEAVGGAVLLVAAALATLMANSPLAPLYTDLLDLPVSVTLGTLGLEMPLLQWINDALMAVFFVLVGLEIKREVLEGELSSPRKALLPGIAAVGGMAVPAALYILVNWGNPAALRGWAIPSATDIAFAVGVLALLGRRVPHSVKVFLLALAIFDDLGAILIIAVFYTAQLSVLALGLAVLGLAVLIALNWAGITRTAPYVLVVVFIWVCMLKSGVHATLAGVLIGLAVPLRGDDRPGGSPLVRLEDMLHPWVTYAILPLFAFANAGVSLSLRTLHAAGGALPLGIALGLFVGKQAGVMAASYGAIRMGLTELPSGCTWRMFHGTAILTGIGFTMSLFIGTLALDAVSYGAALRMGVLAGSLLSASVGFLVLRCLSRPGGEDGK